MPTACPRTLSNKGVAAIGGVRVPIVGRVSMDLITLDVTDLAEPPHVGDEVELLGDTHDAGRSGGRLPAPTPMKSSPGCAPRVPRATMTEPSA